MQIASMNCCLNCSSFVRSAKAPPPLSFFETASVVARKRINSRFPRPSSAIIEEAIRLTHSQGEYSGQDIVSTLDKILGALNERLLQEVRRYNTYSIIFHLLRILDELYYRAASAEWRLGQRHTPLPDEETTEETLSIMRNTGIIGHACERIVEVALAISPNISHLRCSTWDLFTLFELAYEMAQVNYCIESFLCVWKRGILYVTSNEWNFEPELEDQRRCQKLLSNLAIERSQKDREALSIQGDYNLSPVEFQEALQELRKGKNCRRPTKLGEDLDEFILSMDDAHRDQFGHSFSERLLALLSLAQSTRQLPGDWALEDTVLAFVCKQLEVDKTTAQSILDALALTGDGIEHEKTPPFLLRRRFRLMRRPLPKFAVGHRSVYFLSNSFMGRGAINLFAEYINGSHPELQGTRSQRIAQELNQRNARHFVLERIGKVLEKQKFKLRPHVKQIGKWDLIELGIGEIDILALKPGSNKLIVGECKFSALPDVHVRQIRRDLTDYMEESVGYGDKLRRKVEWVREHTSEVLEYIGVPDSQRVPECVPVFFTNLYSPASEFITDIAFVKEYDISTWCTRI